MAWKTRRVQWQWQIDKPPSEVWRYVGDVHTLHKLLGLPTTASDAKPFPVLFSGLGAENDQVERHWIRFGRIVTKATYSQCAVSDLSSDLRLERTRDDHTLVKYALNLRPRSFFAAVILPLFIKHRVQRAFQQLINSLQNEATPLPPAYRKLTAAQETRVKEIKERLEQESFKPEWIDALIEAITQEADTSLCIMRPYSYADSWTAPRHQILSLFAAAAEHGLLRYHWMVCCPHCDRWHQTFASIRELPSTLDCERCQKEILVKLDENVEVVFYPAPTIKTIRQSVAQADNPIWNPRELVRQSILPNALMSLKVQLLPGSYCIHSQDASPETWARFTIKTKGPGEVLCEVTDSGLEVSQRGGLGESRIQLGNRTKSQQVFVLEEDDWRLQRCSVIEAICCHRFRTAFGSDRPHADAPIELGSIALLATDIPAFSQLCTRIGYADAYPLFQKLYRYQQQFIEHHNGAVAKLLGDTIFASFATPTDAIQAAFAIQQGIGAYSTGLSEQAPTKLKLAVHYGDGLAVDLGDRLDLFGDCLFECGNLLRSCRPGEITLTKDLAQQPDIEELVQSNQAVAEESSIPSPRNDKGIEVLRIRASGPTASQEYYSQGEQAQETTAEEELPDFLADLNFDSEESSSSESDSGSGTIYV